MTGTNVAMSFLSAALPGTANRCARWRTPVRSSAARSLVCDSEVHQGEQLVATGTFTFLLMERR